jgi:glutamate/tyrosine decarboxylase-like PLP-dependent enzyme
MANTAHAAYYKAGHYFNIEIRELLPHPKTFEFNATIAKQKVDSNTICVK